MVQIAGKYVHTQSVNFVESLIAKGVPEDKAKQADSDKNMEVQLDGNKVTIINDSRTHSYEFDKETTETGPNGETFKSTAALNGNVIKVISTFSSGYSQTREYIFSDGGVEIVLNGKNGQAKRIFKRA